MKRKLLLSSALVALGVGAGIVVARSPSAGPPGKGWDELSLTIEINATDLDAGIVFFADTDESLEFVRMVGPTGVTVYRMVCNDPLDLGLTEIFWESAEPDIQTPLLAYPEGPYTVVGRAFDGTIIQGVVQLSHSFLPAPQVFVNGDQVPVDNAVVEWVLDPNADRYWMEFEGGEIPEMVFQLPPGISRFQIPESLLEPSTQYKIGLAAVGANGNAVLTEVEFETLP